MWTRFKRALRAFFGSFVNRVEDPERILQQNIRDMNDQVPRMNENIAMVRANVTLLEKEGARLSMECSELTARIKAAIESNRDDLAASYAMRLQSVQKHLARNQAQLDAARMAYEKATQLKKVFLREKELKTQEAMQAIRDHRRAQWQTRVADALESFRVAGIDATHDEMIRRIEERTALNEARMQMALDAVDAHSVRIEEEAEAMRARELVQRFKREMGVLDVVESEAIRLPERTAGQKA
jgi:phage shock protein A